MTSKTPCAESTATRWARFRFSVVGALLTSPPKKGELHVHLEALSQKEWQHPVTGLPLYLSVPTIERWFYRARRTDDPVRALRPKRRDDADRSRTLTSALKQVIRQQYRDHPSWSYQLHWDNLGVLIKKTPDLEPCPSYSTVHRYMKAQGLRKQRRVKRLNTAGAQKAQERLEKREVRSFEVDHVNALWHLDFHHGSRKILTQEGKWHKPLLLTILDDHSRLVCHAQWMWDETTESLVHGFKQALQKRGLPRAVMSDNGSAMTSAEFTQGLARLGILHQPTLPYSPYQNAKQEVFWAQIEGRLMAMLEGESSLSLALMNQATLAWVEFEYHRKVHSEIEATPLDRYLEQHNVGRTCPSTDVLNQAFCDQVKRKQRRSDGTLTIQGRRFEVPSRYRHIETLLIRYAHWDLSRVLLVDPNTDMCIDTLYPQDKSANAQGRRRTLTPATEPLPPAKQPAGIAPLLRDLMDQQEEAGLPPAYIPKDKEKSS